MDKRLVLHKESLAELTDGELSGVGGAEAATTTCVFTIGGSCGIVCHTAGLGCFTDSPPCVTRG